MWSIFVHLCNQSHRTKLSIELTSVGLGHTRPNNNTGAYIMHNRVCDRLLYDTANSFLFP